MGAEYQVKCVMNFFAKINNNNKMFFQFEVNGNWKTETDISWLKFQVHMSNGSEKMACNAWW